MTRELSLAEETTLLLYGSVLNADGGLSDDVFSKYGESGSLVAGALLMDLSARGRLRMERPKPPEKRAKSDGWLWTLGMMALFSMALFGPLAVTVWWNLFPVVPYTFASFPLCLLIILAANLRVALRTGYMVIVDTSSVGEEILAAVLKGLMRIGLRKRPATYIRRYFDIVRLSKDLAYLRAAGMASVRASCGQRKALHVFRDGGCTPGGPRASRLPRGRRAGAAAPAFG